jgi:hypothetical protein
MYFVSFLVVCKPYGFCFVFSTLGCVPSVDGRGWNFVPLSRKYMKYVHIQIFSYLCAFQNTNSIIAFHATEATLLILPPLFFYLVLYTPKRSTHLIMWVSMMQMLVQMQFWNTLGSIPQKDNSRNRTSGTISKEASISQGLIRGTNTSTMRNMSWANTWGTRSMSTIMT